MHNNTRKKWGIIYPYANKGGVVSMLRERLATMNISAFDIMCLFEVDSGGLEELRSQFPEINTVLLSENFTEQVLGYLNQGHFDQVTIIDMPELVNMFEKRPGQTLMYEVHTSIPPVLSKNKGLDIHKIDHIYVPSPWSKETLSQIISPEGHEKIEILPNIIDETAFSPPDKIEPVDGVNLLWVGKINYWKNWKDALRILAMIPGTHKKLTMVTGGVVAEEDLKDFLDVQFRLGITEYVDWIHNLPKPEMAKLYRETARIGGRLLVTTQAESFGLVLAESMLSGLPVVSVDLPALRPLISSSALNQSFPPGALGKAVESIQGKIGAKK